MEKNYTKIRNFALILIIILITIIAFIGIYVKKLNAYKDFIPEYKTGMDFDGYAELKFKLSEESEEKEVWLDSDGKFKGYVVSQDQQSEGDAVVETQGPQSVSEEAEQVSIYKKEKRTIKDNEDSVLNKECYNRTKNIIEKRLRDVGVSEYNMHLDNSTGNLTIDMIDSVDITKLYQLVTSKGELNIIDSADGSILIGSEHIKTASSVYGQPDENSGYQVYLQIVFDKEGANLLKDVSRNYVSVTDSTGNSTTKYIEVQVDGETIAKTFFNTELGNGRIQIPIGRATTDNATFTEYLASTSRMATIIDSGVLDNVYTLASDNFVVSNISDNFIMILKIVACALLVIIAIGLTIAFKGKGLLAGISNIGYVSLLTIMIRYTNVTITINSLIILFMLEVLNIIFIAMLLKGINSTKEGASIAFGNVVKKYYLAIIPVMIFAIILTFATNLTVGTIGMVGFWGLLVQLVYNYVITRTLYL